MFYVTERIYIYKETEIEQMNMINKIVQKIREGYLKEIEE